MTVTINGTTGITNDGGYTGDGVVFADTTPANTLVTTTGGNVGIGTSSPSYPLDVAGAMRGNSWIGRANVSAPTADCAIYRAADNTLAFSTANTERARIDSSGNLLVGTTSVPSGGQKMNIAGGITPAVDNSYIFGNSGLRWQALYAANGTIQTSDERQKTDIVDSPLGLNFVMSLRPVAYKFKVGKNVVEKDADGNDVVTPMPGKRQHFGLLSQQVKQVVGDVDFGGWIHTDLSDPESDQGLRYDEFVAPLIKAIQEQQAIITALTARVAALEGTQNV